MVERRLTYLSTSPILSTTTYLLHLPHGPYYLPIYLTYLTTYLSTSPTYLPLLYASPSHGRKKTYLPIYLPSPNYYYLSIHLFSSIPLLAMAEKRRAVYVMLLLAEDGLKRMILWQVGR